MTTDLIVDLDKATTYAEDLPDHASQLDRYTAAGLAAKVAWSLEARAAKIISIGRRGILEMGQELLQAREEAQYGTWAAFLARCGIEERTAQNYMRVAEQFGDKPEMISALPSTALYALAAPSADPIVVQEIIAEVQSGAPAPTVTAIKQRLAPHAPPPDDAPHLPPDFPAAQARAKRISLYLAMSASGRFILTYETGVRAVAGSADTWPGLLDQLAALERAAATPPPTQTALPSGGDEEIAAAAPAPVALTPLPPALPGLTPAINDLQARKLLVAKRLLLAEAFALLDAQLAASSGPEVAIHPDRVIEAARMFVSNPALGGAAAMLAFSAIVESEGIA